MRKFNIVKKIAIGAAIAAAAGYVAGLLTAPKSGKETRETISREADKRMIKVERELKDLYTELGGLVDKAKDRGGDFSGRTGRELKQIVDKAKDSKEKMRQVISAIHEGEADDRDLDRAVADARHAIDHIKDFMKK